MDVNKIREDFPLLKNRDIIYLDNAATSQKPACVLDAEKRFYEKYNANPFRGLYELSEEATECYEDARKTVADFLHAEHPALLHILAKEQVKDDSEHRDEVQGQKPGPDTSWVPALKKYDNN